MLEPVIIGLKKIEDYEFEVLRNLLKLRVSCENCTIL